MRSIRTWTSTPPRWTNGSTITGTSCPDWGTRGTGCTGPAYRSRGAPLVGRVLHEPGAPRGDPVDLTPAPGRSGHRQGPDGPQHRVQRYAPRAAQLRGWRLRALPVRRGVRVRAGYLSVSPRRAERDHPGRVPR